MKVILSRRAELDFEKAGEKKVIDTFVEKA